MRNRERQSRAGELGSRRAGERVSRANYSSLLTCCLAILASGCSGNSTLEKVRQAMYDQPKSDPLEASTFYANGMASRMPVAGTVARGHLRINQHLHDGRVGGELAQTMPFDLTDKVMARGRERYDIFCTPCHGTLGQGDGMVVRRGMKAPPSFHVDRLRELPIGYTFDVMTNGFGAMYSYASRISVTDRWAIAAYVRALQLSQNAQMSDVPTGKQDELKAMEAK